MMTPMALRATVHTSVGVETLLTAASVADARWRAVFAHAGATHAEWRRELGADALRSVTRLGRHGWTNLMALTATSSVSSASSVERSRDHTPADVAAALDPADLHLLLVGGRRRELLALVPADQVAAAVAGDAAARRVLRREVGRTRLEIAPWLWQVSSAELHATLSDLLPRLPRQEPPPADELRERLRTFGAHDVLALVAPRVTYAEDALERVVLVPSTAVAPVLVEVDLDDLTVLAVPPLADGRPDDAGARMREFSRAAGDPVRLRILQELHAGPATLPLLCERLASPRTTLLHHLALLRGVGLVDVAVSDGPNVYELNASGFAAFAESVQGFTIGSHVSKNLDTDA